MGTRMIGRIYGITLFLITLTGFAQMPIFKRYYIADIPGLGWLAQFYVTHGIHYIMASVLLCLGAYVLVNQILDGGGLGRLTLSGRIKGLLILGLVTSGGFMVVRNLAGVYFSHTAIHVMNLVHLGLCMALLAVSGITLIKGKKWTR